ncbi:MAG: ERF family protein [Kiritimatiellae bacterium]|nr:ERF family protein [Kiritimatiellia bacterium]
MQRSEALGNLAAALARAQSQMKRAEENAVNPFLKNRYADLGAIWDAAREPLAANELSVAQFPAGDGNAIGLTTVLMHSSGEWLADTVFLPLGDERGKSQAQVAGSIISYLRRYGLSAALGITTGEDDDGNAGRDPRQPKQQKQAATPANDSGNGDKPFYAAVVKETPFYASPQDVEDTMALLNLSYPTRADEARQHRATLAEYAQLVADGKSQAEAVATLTKQES